MVTLTGSTFNKIKIEEGAQVTFSSVIVNLKDLEVLKGSTSNLTQVKFSVDCKVLVSKKVKVEENCRINPANRNVVFYIEDDNFEVKSMNTNITASIYNPTHDIKIDGDGPCMMTGRFIAKTIHGHARNVTWNLFECNTPPLAKPVVQANMETEAVTKMEVLVFPNPSENIFNLKLKTQSREDVMIKIFSASGEVVQKLKGTPGAIFRVGHGLLPGIYFAELIQGSEKIMVKMGLKLKLTA